MGALVVTEVGRNIIDLFEPGKEILTYESIDHAVKVTKQALSDFETYSKLARSGQERTLAQHTFSNRARELQSTLEVLVNNERSSGAS
jgi:spore maturation protein CgeB